MQIRSKVEFKGIQKAIDQVKRVGGNVPKAAAEGLSVAAELTMTKAKKQTPVLSGALRSSGHVRRPVIRGSKISVELGFGGPAGVGNMLGEVSEKDVGYAVYVHENLQARHKVGNAKYLERPLLAAGPTINHQVTLATDREIKRVLHR